MNRFKQTAAAIVAAMWIPLVAFNVNCENHEGPILGIDVSHFQGDIHWKEVDEAKIRFAYAKATQSTDYRDPDFERNWKAIKAAGVAAGAYHFFVAGEDPLQQAETFVRTVGRLESGDMPPMIDLEPAGMRRGIRKKRYQKHVFTWLKIVEEDLGTRPIIYTDYYFARDYLTDPRFGKYPLWIAAYGVEKPEIPDAWAKHGWTIWQRAERGTVAGVAGNVDHDIFNGDWNKFQDFLVK